MARRPSLEPSITVRIGPRASALVSGFIGLSDPTPFVAWVNPEGTIQKRFRVKIECVEGGGYAKMDTGIRGSTDQQYQFIETEALNSSFRGLCRVLVDISSQDSGILEYSSPWVYFVFDPEMERLPSSDPVVVEWDAVTNPDGMPLGGGVTYELQICATPMFDTDLEYGRSDITAGAGEHVIHEINPVNFTPYPDVFYFYRVRAFDGLDWGYWSRVNAFYQHSGQMPVFTIDDVASVGDTFGDVDITFTITGDVHDHYSVAFSFLGGKFSTNAEPMYLIDPAALVSNGTHVVRWRTVGDPDTGHPPDQIGYSRTNVTIYGTATSTLSVDSSDHYDFMVDNSGGLSGGGPPTPYVYPIRLGWVITRPAGSDLPPERFPVRVRVAIGKLSGALILPITGARMAWYNVMVIGTLESREELGFNLRNPYLYWPSIITDAALGFGTNWLQAYGEREETNKYIRPGNQKFIFTQPRDDSYPDTLPRPHQSTNYSKMQRFLRGYRDLDGNVVEYPNAYDWTARPAWHRGREVWGEDDAWIQVGTWKFTEYEHCSTCGGRHWVPSEEGPPYDRLTCPNPDCVDGFDHTKPFLWIRESGHVPFKWVTMKATMYVEWHRLSRWIDGPFTYRKRRGFAAKLHGCAFMKAHVVGRQPSSQDKVLEGQTLVGYDIETPTGMRRLPAGTPMIFNFAGTPVTGRPTRQPDDWISLKMFEVNGTQLGGGDVETRYPLHSRVTKAQAYDDAEPARIIYGKNKRNFYMGQVNPDSSPLAWNRPRPTQPGSLVMPMKYQRAYYTRNLSFRFLDLQGTWDSFMTLHFQYTTSASTKIHLQYRDADSADENAWRDILAENGEIDPDTGLWMVPALEFHAYWDTVNTTQFADGARYNLRVQSYNVDAGTFSNFVYSPVLTINHQVSNPVAVISSIYEPWEKTVTIRFRCDDTQNDAYSIVRMYYSVIDQIQNIPNAWIEIPMGSVSGNISYLTSVRYSQDNEHEILWHAGDSGVTASNEIRVRIEVVPTNSLERITLPFFKWLSDRNPQVDGAEVELADIMGHVQTQHFDDATGLWVADVPPVYVPGQIRLLEMEYEQVKESPGQTVGPSGYYSFWEPTPTGYILTDADGYQTWLKEYYTASETHSRAMGRISQDMDRLIRVVIPRDQEIVIDGEKSIRKTLIRQGYYAEDHFKMSSGNYREVIDAVPVSSRQGEEMPATQERWWQFRVQNRAIGGDDLYNAENLFEPKFVTTLEQVFYKVQLDRTQAFKSQPFGKPLREFIFGHTDERLSIAQFYGGQAPSGNITVSGTLKIKPDLLPGEVEGDTMIADQTDWDGTYYWRVAAYNYLVDAVNSRPRALITHYNINGNELELQYLAQAHQDITSASLWHAYDAYYYLTVYGYDVSDTTTASFWTDLQLIDFVSDHRGLATEPTRQSNGIAWVPTGKDRQQPNVFWDPLQQQYQLFMAKLNDAGKMRVIGARSMCLPKACETESFYGDSNVLGIYGPSVIYSDNAYWMFATVDPGEGGSSYIAYAQSEDGDEWGDMAPVDGVAGGGNPCVIKDGDTWMMWFQRSYAGHQCLFLATSIDGFSWAMANNDNPVWVDLTDVGRPSVIKMNGVFILYANDLGSNTIFSIWSIDGITWQGRKVELSPTAVNIDGNNLSVFPRNPSVFLDVYMGNVELFMCFNYVKVDNNNLTFVARLEDRVWRPGHVNDINGSLDHMIDVPFSQAGVARNLIVRLAENNMSGDNYKVRLMFNTFAPANKEYHRQSQWVDLSNFNDLGAFMDPQPWEYDDQIKGLRYLRETNA